MTMQEFKQRLQDEGHPPMPVLNDPRRFESDMKARVREKVRNLEQSGSALMVAYHR
jgi:hypothetical protein